MVKACGQGAVNNVLADGTIPLEDVLNPLPSCKLDLCRGAVFEDNEARVQRYSPGQMVPFKAILPIAHEGPANVSIVKTATNRILGNMLLVFDSYADEKLKQLPANNTNFAVTNPTGLAATDCRVAGECVLQWFWFGTAARQTYESCVDFVVVSAASNNSSGAGGSTTTSLVLSSSTVATSTAFASATSAATVSEGTSGSITSSSPSGFTTTPSTAETSGSHFADASCTTTSSISSSSSSSLDGSYGGHPDGSSADGSPDDSFHGSSDGSSDGSSGDPTSDDDGSSDTSAAVSSVPIPELAPLADGAFGGTAGRIPELNPDGTPVEDSFGGTQGSVVAVTEKLRRFVRPDDVTIRS